MFYRDWTFGHPGAGHPFGYIDLLLLVGMGVIVLGATYLVLTSKNRKR